MGMGGGRGASHIRNSYLAWGGRLLKCDQYGVILMNSDTQSWPERNSHIKDRSLRARGNFVQIIAILMKS